MGRYGSKALSKSLVCLLGSLLLPVVWDNDGAYNEVKAQEDQLGREHSKYPGMRASGLD